MHIEVFNNKLLNRYSKVLVEDLKLSLEKVFEQELKINIVFVKQKEIKRLNREYRKTNFVTDVLSFSLDDKGEVYICPKYVKKSFKNEDFLEEIVRLSIHGILHLLGYDHRGSFEKGNKEEIFEIQEKKVKEVLSLLERRMYLIVGLGNPKDEYENNRHNVGYMCLDRLVNVLEEKGFESTGWKLEKIFDSNINIFEKDGIKTILLKPTTFMNNSGIAVKKVLKKYKLSDLSKELILVHDDLDLPLGEYKIQLGKSPKGHNGVNNVEDHLGTAQFSRIRIGIDNRKDMKIPGEKYVLMDFSEDEKVTLFESIDSAIQELILNLN